MSERLLRPTTALHHDADDALGGGLDIRATDSIDIRLVQLDYLPVFFDDRREDGFRFCGGEDQELSAKLS